MFDRLSTKILAPIVVLMMALGVLLYFMVLRTVEDFARANIENDLQNLNHDLFNVADNAFMQVVKGVKADDRVAIRIGQVDCLDMLERRTLSDRFKLIVYEGRTGAIRLASHLPGQANPREIIRRFQGKEDGFTLRTAEGNFYIRQFYFAPWDWKFIVLKNTRTFTELTEKVSRVHLTSAIVLLVGTILLVTYLLRSIRGPIAAIVSSVSRGESPDYRGTYEFEFLSRAIGEMRKSLKDGEGALKRANDELEQRVEERTRELQEIHRQLLHVEKLSAIGTLSASIAHEFNNPLYGIQTVFEGIRKYASLEKHDVELVDLAMSECDRVRKLIKDLQDFNRPSPGVRELTDLHAVIDHMCALMGKELEKHGIELRRRFAPEKPKVRVVPDQIKQVVLNLLTNAREAMQGAGGTITIATEVSNPHVTISVGDTGEGIAPGDLAHIFEPFFTTKGAVRGTGLGLSVSYGIVKAHGGELRVTSEPERGTTFTIQLPVSEER